MPEIKKVDEMLTNLFNKFKASHQHYIKVSLEIKHYPN